MAKKKPASPPRAALIVLGMHRSGTSALAGVLARMGADLPQNLMPANEANPRGYFESLKAFQLNDALLSSAGSSWNDWREFNPDWYRSPRKNEYEGRATEMLAQEFGTSSFFVLKDPRVCRLVPFWKGVMSKNNIAPLFICTHRNPQEVAASLSRREGFSESTGLLLWLRHVLDAEAGSRGAARVFVSYNGLLADWRQTVARISEGFALHWPVSPDTAAPEVEGFLSESLRHFSPSNNEGRPSTMIAGWIGEVHAILDNWASHGETENDHQRLDAIRTSLREGDGALSLLMKDNHLQSRSAQQQKLEIENLRARIAELENAVQTARQEAISHAANHATEQKSRGAAEAKVAELDQALIAARAETEALQANHVSEQQAHAAAEAKVAELSNVLETARAERAALSAQLESTKENLRSSDITLAEAEHNTEILVQEKAKLQSELAQRSFEAEEVGQHLKSAQREIQQLTHDFEKTKAERDALSAEHKDMAQRLRQEKVRLEEKMHADLSVALRLHREREKVAQVEGKQLEAKLNDAARQITSLSQELDNARTARDTLNAERDVFLRDLRIEKLRNERKMQFRLVEAVRITREKSDLAQAEAQKALDETRCLQEEAEGRVRALMESTSWRLTAPIRRIVTIYRDLSGRT